MASSTGVPAKGLPQDPPDIMNAMSNDWADPPARRCPYGAVAMHVRNLEPSAGTSILRFGSLRHGDVALDLQNVFDFSMALRGTRSPDRHPTPRGRVTAPLLRHTAALGVTGEKKGRQAAGVGRCPPGDGLLGPRKRR